MYKTARPEYGGTNLKAKALQEHVFAEVQDTVGVCPDTTGVCLGTVRVSQTCLDTFAVQSDTDRDGLDKIAASLQSSAADHQTTAIC